MIKEGGEQPSIHMASYNILHVCVLLHIR